MAEGDSDCSSSALSEGDTVSSSGLGNYDVAIYFHQTIYDKAVDAEKILIEDGITSCLSQRDIPAARLKLVNLHSIAKHSDLRVFVVTDKFVKEDFAYHLRLLGNANLSTRENTLLLMKRKHRRYIPEYVRDLTCGFFDDRITGEAIAHHITQFMYKDALECAPERRELATMSIEDDELRNQENLDKYQAGFQRFSDMFGKVTKKRCYILIASAIRDTTPTLGLVASIPWVRVFDFDPKSSVNGLLLWADEALSKKNHTKTNRPDYVDTPDDNVTNWVSIAGDVDNAEALQMRDNGIPECAIFRHGECLAEYCVGQKVPVILVMWYPQNGEMDNTLDSFLSGLRHHFMARLQSFNCIICVKETPKQRGSLWRTLERLNLLTRVIVVPVGVLCLWLQTSSMTIPTASWATMTLPKYPDQGEELETVEIEQEDLSWIRSQLHILVSTVRDPCNFDSEIPDEIKQSGLAFLRGREIDWNVIEYGGYDVNRDLLDMVKKYIQDKHINTGKSGLVTIFHAPGGGGTTFARRLLYEVHDRVPSGELISDRIALKALEERLTTLRNLTLLPTLLLLDGKSIHDVKRILAIGTKLRIIVVHVRRYVHESEKAPNGEGKFFLRANVSQKEGKKFSEIYGKAAPQKRSSLKSLSDKVNEGKSHYVFEYGLTAFQSQYEGARRYVFWYLNAHDTSKDLQDWHTVLVFLSMANYYGHRGLPCKLFSKLLEKHDNVIVELEDLPHEAQQFITEADESWKITHFVISKLILEQVLVRREKWEFEVTKNSLTPEACRQLCKWALLFIDNVRKYHGNSKFLATHIWGILTSIFIRRDYDDPGENELGSKTHYSKLIEEINSSEEQGIIFKKLAESFPRHAEFRAHLGRFHSKQGEFDQADKCFKIALEARRQEIRDQESGLAFPKAKQDLVRGDDVLERIYNMSAFACISHIRSKIGARMGKMSAACLRGRSVPDLTKFCLEKAVEAIKNFENGRWYYQKGSNPSFANLGELKIRLQLTELAKHISGNNFNSLLQKGSPLAYRELGDFVLKSFHECDVLLAQCISDRSKNIEIPEEEINFCFNQFNYFFRNATEALKQWAGKDSSIHSMKCHLSILKIKLKQNRKNFKLNCDIKTTEEIENLVELCEQICDTVWKTNASNVRISNYMTEWLRAIRHKSMRRSYSQVDVLSRVERWKSKEQIGTLANFYYYVLTTVLSLSSISRDIANAYAKSSHKIKEYLRSNDITPLHLHDINEWLGRSDTPNDFNRLIHSSDLGEWKGKFWAEPEKISLLHVCTGSIVFCRPHDGIIVMEGGRDPPIHVFFVPQKYDITVSHSRKKTRVEFYLGFNPRHLAQAFEVTPLKKYHCPNPSCRAPTEIPTLGKSTEELVTPCNMCETIVSISHGDPLD